MNLTKTNTMKLTIKLFLIISLFCSTAFAEGDMDAGGFTCVECTISNESKNLNENDESKDFDENDSIIKIIQEYLGSLLG